jgi:hypothetical protein
MPVLGSVALSLALLAAAPGQAETNSPPSLTEAQAFTIVANVLGAATACEAIAHTRLSAAAREVGTRATAQATSLEEFTSVERLLMASAAAGRQAVEGGETDCPTVEAAFSEVEQIVLQTPVVQHGAAPVRPGSRQVMRASSR